MHRRRPALSSSVAVLLIVLAAAPWTAPYQVFDISVPAGEIPANDGVHNDKTSKECAIPVFFWQSAPLVEWAIFTETAREWIREYHGVSLIALRI